MDHDEDTSSAGSRVDAVPFQDKQSIIGIEYANIREASPAPTEGLPPSAQGGLDQAYGVGCKNIRISMAPPTALVGEHRASLFERANSLNSCLQPPGNSEVPSSEYNLKPALNIGVNPRIINATTGSETGEQWREMHRAESARSERSKADYEVIVTGQAAETSEMLPTPLGRARRMSLFERANTSPSNVIEGCRENVLPVESVSSNNSSLLDERRAQLGSHKNRDSLGGTVSPRPGQYDTVQRDWLMHVLEKDDHEDAQGVQNIWAAARRQRRLAHRTFEAADYELYDSKVWHTHKQDSVTKTRHGAKDLRKRRKEVGRWLTVALGVAVGVTGCFVTFFTEGIIHAKLHFISHIIEVNEGSSGIGRYGMAFGWLWLINSVLAAGAFGMVWYQPWSNGSGIPETKCVLNGVSIPQVLAPSTLVSKVLGVILGVASGLPIGKEGPMIHAGATIGGSIASLPRIKCLLEFRNDRDRRDLAAMGTAAGVAAAFRTPIGGVLFALEEGASFWTTVLTWRSFAAAVVTVVVYYLIFEGKNMFKQPLEAADIFLFGEFQDSESSFFMWELTLFALIATLGGLIGVGFVAVNKRLALFRARHISGARRRFVEIIAVSTLVTIVAFFLPLAIGECRPVPTNLEGWSPAGIESIDRLVTLNCHHGEYNELGTLFLNEQDGMIKLLFHFGAPGIRVSSSLIFAGVFITLQCLASGVWVSSGLFIPSILVGAAMGRGIGGLMGRNSRAYALVGAAGILGGITRMTLSVTVMMVEASGWVLFVIPLMLVFITARSVGNRFNEGIYDTQISIKKMPFLEQEPPEEARTQNMRANQLMSKEVVCLRPVETVEAVTSILRDYDHNCFPVVENRDQRVLLGVVYRPDDSLASLPWATLEKSYPDYPNFEDLEIREGDMECLMDIAAYVQIGPHVINEHASAHRAYIMFRTLGLRHLVVVNHYNEVMGIITRENLLPEHFEHGGAYHTMTTKDLEAYSAA